MPVTTQSNHQRRVYPNLAGDLVLEGINQLWVADITYVRLQHEFVYLAVLEDKLTLAALRMALKRRCPAGGLVQHSDRGVQYASLDDTGLLQQHGITISMSRKGNPYDNAFCESFMKTLKHEEMNRQEYRDLAEARRSIERSLEQVFNGKRLHSALAYRPPVEFELSLLPPPASLPLSQVTA